MGAPEPKKIKKSRRLLLIGPPDSGLLEVLKRSPLSELTGSAPDPIDGSIAGISHVWQNKTKYYEVEVPIWVDEIAAPKSWAKEFKEPEAKDVVESIGAYVYCFRKPKTEDDFNSVLKGLEAIDSVVDEWLGPAFDGAKTCFVNANRERNSIEKSIGEWEELCEEQGFEYVDSAAVSTKNQASALGRVGYDRLREALQVVDWDADELENDYSALDDGALLDDWDNQQGGDGLDGELAEMRMEFGELGLAMEQDRRTNGEDEHDIDGFDKLLVEAMGIRDTGSAMPEAERKKFSERAINNLIKKYEL